MTSFEGFQSRSGEDDRDPIYGVQNDQIHLPEDKFVNALPEPPIDEGQGLVVPVFFPLKYITYNDAGEPQVDPQLLSQLIVQGKAPVAPGASGEEAYLGDLDAIYGPTAPNQSENQNDPFGSLPSTSMIHRLVAQGEISRPGNHRTLNAESGTFNVQEESRTRHPITTRVMSRQVKVSALDIVPTDSFNTIPNPSIPNNIVNDIPTAQLPSGKSPTETRIRGGLVSKMKSFFGKKEKKPDEKTQMQIKSEVPSQTTSQGVVAHCAATQSEESQRSEVANLNQAVENLSHANPSHADSKADSKTKSLADLIMGQSSGNVNHVLPVPVQPVPGTVPSTVPPAQPSIENQAIESQAIESQSESTIPAFLDHKQYVRDHNSDEANVDVHDSVSLNANLLGNYSGHDKVDYTAQEYNNYNANGDSPEYGNENTGGTLLGSSFLEADNPDCNYNPPAYLVSLDSKNLTTAYNPYLVPTDQNDPASFHEVHDMYTQAYLRGMQKGLIKGVGKGKAGLKGLKGIKGLLKGKGKGALGKSGIKGKKSNANKRAKSAKGKIDQKSESQKSNFNQDTSEVTPSKKKDTPKRGNKNASAKHSKKDIPEKTQKSSSNILRPNYMPPSAPSAGEAGEQLCALEAFNSEQQQQDYIEHCRKEENRQGNRQRDDVIKTGSEIIAKREQELAKLRQFTPYQNFLRVKEVISKITAMQQPLQSVIPPEPVQPDYHAMVARRRWKQMCDTWRLELRMWVSEVLAIWPEEVGKVVVAEDKLSEEKSKDIMNPTSPAVNAKYPKASPMSSNGSVVEMEVA